MHANDHCDHWRYSTPWVGYSDLVFSFLVDCPSTCACVIRTVLKGESYTASLIHSLGGVVHRLLKFEYFFNQISEISENLLWREKIQKLKKAYVNKSNLSVSVQ